MLLIQLRMLSKKRIVELELLKVTVTDTDICECSAAVPSVVWAR